MSVTSCAAPGIGAPRWAVVMAGGAGTRFWPRSRARLPKQLLSITGRRSMLADTLARIAPLVPPARRLIVTARAQVRAARMALREGPSARVLAEPMGRNTAAAIALAALHIARESPGAVMVVLPADHAIAEAGLFRADLATALGAAARSAALVTLGIRPTHPETGYGYIVPGTTVAGTRGRVARVARFVEKPSRRRAAALRVEGAFWNAGIFVWRVDAILGALRRHLPAIVTPLEEALRRGGRGALRRAYARLPATSIDHGVLERARDVLVVRARFGWSDVGSWAAVEPFWRNGSPNAVRGRAIAVDSRGCIVDSPRRVVALLGVDDLVVVDSPDAILVCPKSRAQEVRRVVDALRAARLDRCL